MKDVDPATISELLMYVIGIAPYDFAREVYKQRPQLYTPEFDELQSKFGNVQLCFRADTMEAAIVNIKPEYRELALSLIAEYEMFVL